MRAKIINADCKDVLAKLPSDSIDSVVTDPPYELGFMNKGWDSKGIAYDVKMWAEVLRVLKPGGYALVFGGTRTYHRMAVAIEDAGFEIVDSIDWIYGSGFPKALDISKAIDKKLGKERPVIGTEKGSGNRIDTATAGGTFSGTQGGYNFAQEVAVTSAATPEAKQWEGWKTQLKPAHEPIVVARKPFVGTSPVSVLLEIQLRAQGVTEEIEWA